MSSRKLRATALHKKEIQITIYSVYKDEILVWKKKKSM